MTRLGSGKSRTHVAATEGGEFSSDGFIVQAVTAVRRELISSVEVGFSRAESHFTDLGQFERAFGRAMPWGARRHSTRFPPRCAPNRARLDSRRRPPSLSIDRW